MPLTMATISGSFVRPDGGAGAMTVYIEAATDGTRLTYGGSVIVGKFQVPIQRDGTATVSLPLIPQTGLLPSGALWRLVMAVGRQTYTKVFSLTGDTTWGALVDVSNVPVTQSIVADATAARDAAIAAAASVAYSTWQATHAYVTDQTVQAPDGSLIKSTASRTSRATFDATEQTFWTVVSAKTGTLDQVALARSIFLAKPTIFDGVKKQLNDSQTVAISYLTDSTGNDATLEHIGLTCDRLHALWPNYRIEFLGYDNGSPNNYTAALRVIKYAGPTTERRVTFVGTVNSGLLYSASSVSQITGDLDVRAKVTATTWNAAAERTIASKFGAGGARSWRWYLDGSNVNFQYTTDGSTLITAVSALSNFTLVNGTPTGLRVVLDVDNGAAGRDVKFYQSTDDGATWVQKGATVTVATAIALFSDAVTALELGARSVGTAGNWVGDIYWCQIRQGIDGAIVAPTLPDLWTGSTSAFDGVYSGDPIIQVWAGAASGWGTSNFITNANLMIPAAGQSLHLMSTSHNDGFIRDAQFWARWDSLFATARLRAPSAAFGVFNENPETAPHTAAQIAAHQWRCRQMEVYAASRGYEFTDVYTAFLTSGQALSALVNTGDGTHPTNAGSIVWATAIQDRWHIAP